MAIILIDSKSTKNKLLIFGYVKTSGTYYTKMQNLFPRNDGYYFNCVANLAFDFG